MLRKIKKMLRRYRQGEHPGNTEQGFKEQADLWLKQEPLERTLGPARPLPLPTVNEPTAAQLAGHDVPEFPSYIALEVTNVCNLQCKHCNYRFGLPHYTRDRGFANRQTIEKILNEANLHGISVLMNYDGEPLMHRDFIDYLQLATELGVNTYFNTNGTLFDKAFADRLVTFYTGSVFFSIDGSKEWFERIRVPAKYEQVVANFNYFIQANEAKGWPITIGVGFCNLGQSVEDRREFLDKWLPRVNYVSMGEVNDKFGTVISEPMTVLHVRKRPVCVVPWQTCGICHNGDIIPCSIYVTRANTANAIFGNIYEQSIRDIWHGEKFTRFRQMIAQEQYEASFCEKCQRWLCQFSFPDVIEGDTKISHNGLWTTFQNLSKGPLNFRP
ncbi:MAG: SPASM domain-containing protein [Phycisphaerae bacterium]|nr:SPASM domain-containing protein [Phycisphaerae bacterium]